MKIKSVIFPLFAVFALAGTMSASAHDINGVFHSPTNSTPSLVHSVIHGDSAEVKRLLAAKTSPNAANRNGNTALMLAVDRERTAIIKLLLAAKANPNLKNKSGTTALMKAATGDYAEGAKLLLSAGADVNMTNNSGQNALSLAKSYNHSKVMRILTTDAKGNGVVAKQPKHLSDSYALSACKRLIKREFVGVAIDWHVLGKAFNKYPNGRTHVTVEFTAKELGVEKRVVCLVGHDIAEIQSVTNI